MSDHQLQDSGDDQNIWKKRSACLKYIMSAATYLSNILLALLTDL